MAIDKTFSATRRRNVTPTSSILRIVTRDVDCSAFPVAPEDGQFVIAAGATTGTGDAAATGFSNWGAGTALVFYDSVAGIANITADVEGASLKMVWGSALQTDRQALGNTKVPVLWLGGVEVECQLFNGDAGQALNVTYTPGSLVTVEKAKESVQGTQNRLVLCPLPAANIGWAVGYVTKAPTDNGANGKSITVMLYDQPRKIGQGF